MFRLRSVAAILLLGTMPVTPVIASSNVPSTDREWAQAAVQLSRVDPSASTQRSPFAVAPDGRSVVYVVWRGDVLENLARYDLMIVDVDRPNQTRILFSTSISEDDSTPAQAPITQVSFSHDGRWITFAARGQNQVIRFYRVDRRGGLANPLTSNASDVAFGVIDDSGKIAALATWFDLDSTETSNEAKRGGFVSDKRLFPYTDRYQYLAAVFSRERKIRGLRYSTEPRRSEIYRSTDNAAPGLLTSPFIDGDVLSQVGKFIGSPNANRAIIYPYYASRPPAFPGGTVSSRQLISDPAFQHPSYGLVDLNTAQVRPITIGYGFSSGVIWRPDSLAALLQVPVNTTGSNKLEWAEFDFASQSRSPVPLSDGWRPVRFTADGRSIIVRSDHDAGLITRTENNLWTHTKRLNDVSKTINWDILDDNLEKFVKIKESSSFPPEVVVYASDAIETSRSNFNAHARTLPIIPAKPLIDVQTGEELALVIEPPAKTRDSGPLPAIFLLDDSTLRGKPDPYILDGVAQLGAYLPQGLASAGFVVVYLREPNLTSVLETPEEPLLIMRHYERAVKILTDQGRIDRTKIGISGWSRAAYYTNYILINSAVVPAAATTQDGGRKEYIEKLRPLFDKEIERIKSPLMMEGYGKASAAASGEFAGRLRSFQLPVEVLYLPNAPHNPVLPLHRIRSLTANLAWFRFWILGEEDLDEVSPTVVDGWKKMRDEGCAKAATNSQRLPYCQLSTK